MKSRTTQRGKILQLLREREGGWVPSYELAAIALQYGARVLELRRAGYNIENRMQEVDGQTYGAFRLVPTGDQTSLFDAGLEAQPQAREHWGTGWNPSRGGACR